MEAQGLAAPPGDTWAQLVDELLTKHVEPTLVQPTFLFDYPVELSPFAKVHRDDPRLAERCEAYCEGMEIANAFTELNDPDEQRRASSSSAPTRPRVTRRRSRTTRRSCRRSSRACRRPAASASGSTGS